jgi:antagonist of KipI
MNENQRPPQQKPTKKTPAFQPPSIIRRSPSTVRIYIEKAGLQTTVQDLGRFGLRSFGIPTSGAMDAEAHKMANVLVGNPKDAPTLEMTLKGDRVHFLNHALIAITGANMSPKLNEVPFPMYKAVIVQSGDVLNLGYAKTGCRAYLAIQGKLQADFDFNSYSTYFYGKFGGFKGRKLEDDDVLCFEKGFSDVVLPSVLDNETAKITIPVYDTSPCIRILPAPEFEWFPKSMVKQFLNTKYSVTADNNRMGMKLKGEPILLNKERKMISSPTALGTIQVLPNGQLIVLLQDGQTTGGYPRIANIVMDDIGKLVQLRAGNSLKFSSMDNVFLMDNGQWTTFF